MVTIFMMPAKMATLGLLKIKVFQNKGYDFCSWCHQQNFITGPSLKLYCGHGHIKFNH